jgi:hypothetical protein
MTEPTLRLGREGDTSSQDGKLTGDRVPEIVQNKRTLAVAMQVAIAEIPAPVDIIVTDADEIDRRGHLVGTVLRPALREGKVVYDRAA